MNKKENTGKTKLMILEHRLGTKTPGNFTERETNLRSATNYY
jgi:hypothetical protein